MIIYCLTGSIATGKTTISNLLEKKGLIILDTDKIVHNMYKKIEVINIIKKNFGDKYIKENQVNRKELAKLVFNNKDELEKLNKLIHPLVKEEVIKLTNYYKEREELLKKNFLLIYVIPLYFETGKNYKVDKIVLAYCPKNIQLQRLIIRDNIDKEEALKKINSQISIEEKVKYSDIIINTNQEIDLISKDLDNILKNINYDKTI